MNIIAVLTPLDHNRRRANAPSSCPLWIQEEQAVSFFRSNTRRCAKVLAWRLPHELTKIASHARWRVMAHLSPLRRRTYLVSRLTLAWDL